MQAKLEMADILQKIWPNKDTLKLNGWQVRTLDAIRRCRTAELGGHIDACDGCGNISISYNSCRNRHCPKCQGEKREEWIAAREAELLPVPYFHVVFTLPSELNQLAMHEPKAAYDALFAATWQTVAVFAKDEKHLNAQAGMISILHTWGQNLSLHPHLHCIIPGDGVDVNGKWRKAKTEGKFLFPVKAMSVVFRAKYLAELRKKLKGKVPQTLLNELYKKAWVVYAKRPFGSPKSVVEYLGRYTHKVAISNHRIKNVDENSVTFTYKDYKTGAQIKEMTLSLGEFIRRFSQHILPKGLVRIRHYGILSSTWKRGKLAILQQKLWKENLPTQPLKCPKVRRCPCCKGGSLRTILSFDHRGPPESFRYLWDKSIRRTVKSSYKA
jgi:Putative transposase/Transposase zinc-binding domain